MQKLSNKSGLAVGVVAALLSSLVIGTAPATAAGNADGEYIALTPTSGPVTNFNGVLDAAFPVSAYLLPGVQNSNFVLDSLATTSNILWEVTKTSGNMNVSVSSTATVLTGTPTPQSLDIFAASTSALTVSAALTNSGTVAEKTPTKVGLTFTVNTASGIVSSSPNVTLLVKMWIENPATKNGKWDALEWFTTKTVTLRSLNNVSATTTLTQPIQGDTVITASATVGDLNFENQSGVNYFLQLESNRNMFVSSTPSSISSDVGGSALQLRNGVVSQSFAVSGSGIVAGATFSAQVRLSTTSGAIDGGTRLGAVANYSTTVPAITVLSTSAVANANVLGGGTAYDVRANQTYTVRVHAGTGSPLVSVSGVAVSVGITGTGLVTSSKEISINGGALTTVYPTALSLTTGADGYASFTIRTSGFLATNNFIVSSKVGNITPAAVTFTTQDLVYSIMADFDDYVTQPGTAVSLPYSVEDQFEETSARSDQFLKVTRGGTGFSYATTISYVAVTAGAANVSFVPEAATKTGSATVKVELVRLISGAYVADGSSTTTTRVAVSSTADSFGAGLKASYSSSISYFASTVSWVAVSGKVTNTGSAVVITGDASLVFRVSSAVSKTASGAITVRAGSGGAYSFEVATTKTGPFALSLANGAATTTSQVVAAAAASDMGASIKFDTSAIEAGKTRIVIGTVLDANGNPVNTTGVGRTAGDAGTASITVTFTGTAGIPVGAMPTETDADGNFRVSVLTSAQDRGTFTLTAVYLAKGAATAAADKITAVQSITVDAAAPVVETQKVNVGSFKGFVALYAKGYEGQRMSAIVAGKWIQVASLKSGFERVVRFTGAGYNITVKIYIDGKQVGSDFMVLTK